MFDALRSLFAKPRLSSAQKAALASSLGVSTRATHDHCSRAQRATLNGLLIAVPQEDRERCEAKLAEVLRLKGSA